MISIFVHVRHRTSCHPFGGHHCMGQRNSGQQTAGRDRLHGCRHQRSPPSHAGGRCGPLHESIHCARGRHPEQDCLPLRRHYQATTAVEWLAVQRDHRSVRPSPRGDPLPAGLPLRRRRWSRNQHPASSRPYHPGNDGHRGRRAIPTLPQHDDRTIIGES